MIVRDAHRELAFNLGDPVIIESSASSLPDGVRFSALLRNGYLNRAILNTYRSILQEIYKINDKEIRKTLIQQYFNNSIKYETLTLINDTDANGVTIQYDDLDYKAFSIQHLIGFSTFNSGTVPIPVKDNPLSVHAMYNTRSTQVIDAFAIHSKLNDRNRIIIYDPKGELTNSADVGYLPVPDHPKDQALNDDLMIDDAYINTVLKRATLYGKLDSQDVEDPSMYNPEI